MGAADMDFSHEVAHSDRLLVRGKQPFNAEPTAAALVEFKYTPEELIYCRNHSPVEELDEDTYVVKVDGLVKKSVEHTITDLRERYEQVEVVAALQCAGNRRKEMDAIKKVKGITWDSGVIANCRWRGVRLRDILIYAGIDTTSTPDGQALHVWFASHVSKCQDDSYYGGSIPLEKALDPEGYVLLALDMNDEPLSPDHGYPLRAVVPGYTGARWVKWVDHITVATAESPNFYQQRDYKILPPTVETSVQAAEYWDKVKSITSLPVNSVIASIGPVPGAVSDEKVLVKGYAMGAGGKGRQIASVQVALLMKEREEEWMDARITYQEGQWSWTLWESVLDIADAKAAAESATKRELTILCRARDEAGETQRAECSWNMRGVSYNAYNRAVWRW